MDCKGLSLGLDGRVRVFGQGRRDSDIGIGVKELGVGDFEPLSFELGVNELVVGFLVPL